MRLLRVLTGERYSGLPYFLMGHSMGSFVARTYLIRWPGTLDGCILSGTGQESAATVSFGKAVLAMFGAIRGWRALQVLQRPVLGMYNRKFAPNRTGADWISRDNNVVDAYVADPLCSFLPTAGMSRDMMEGLQFIADQNNLARMDPETPIYLFSGDQDPVGAMGEGCGRYTASSRTQASGT